MEVIKKRRPPRVARACENCRRRKIKCTGGSTCRECAKYGEQCVTRPPGGGQTGGGASNSHRPVINLNT